MPEFARSRTLKYSSLLNRSGHKMATNRIALDDEIDAKLVLSGMHHCRLPASLDGYRSMDHVSVSTKCQDAATKP